MNCRNHPDRAATHLADMPSPIKRASDRLYREDVPLCEECARHMAALGGYRIQALR